MEKNNKSNLIKKILIGFIGAALLVMGTWWLTITKYEKKINDLEKHYSKVQLEHKERLAELEQKRLNGMLGDFPSTNTIVEIMHMMTHQKVNAGNNHGVIAMNKSNIEMIIQAIKNGNPINKGELLEIASRWQKWDFSKTVEEHNYLANYIKNKEDKATRLLDRLEEQTFILNELGDNAAREESQRRNGS